MESFSLLRTNPYLTTNVKVVRSNDMLYFESFDASSTLGDDNYKRIIIPEGSFYNRELIKFWKGTPPSIAFESKDLEDYDIMYDRYDDQIDDTYLSGAANVKDTDYPEEFEYLAPLHVYQNKLPKDFVIFRVDGPGIIDLKSANFRTEILDKMKVVDRVDLRPETKLGKFLENSFNQDNLPETSVDIDFRQGEFTYWNGIDYNTGEYVKKSKIMDDEFKREMTFTQGNDIISSGFKDNGIIYPYIINLKFLFDDTPATPDELKKWSINRYYGFYGTLEEVDMLTPYKPPTLKSGLRLTSSNIFTLNGIPVDPFERGYKTDRTYYVEYLSKFYLVDQVEDGIFKVISDIVLPSDVDSNFNLNTITIGDDNVISLLSGEDFSLDIDSDVVVIEIDGKFHRLLFDGTDWKILSDYKFTVSNNIFRYLINKSDPSYTTVINLNNVDRNNPPKSFNVYQLNFNPIKDFDLNLLESDFAKFEYRLLDEVTETEEPKLYEDDINFVGIPKPIQQYIHKNRVVSIPTGSEFLSTSELYEVNDSKPNEFWKKNSSLVKWGIQGSISNNDYPYMFNVNSKADDYNRTTNTEELIPNRISRNLDYFYTVATQSFNFGYTSSVIYQSLSTIHDDFEIEKYFNNGTTYSTNYFDEVFGQTETYNSVKKPRRKYSDFLKGDQITPNETFFKGIKISTYDVDSILTNITDGNKSIDSINVKGTNKFENYKFSIVFSDLDTNPDEDFVSKNLLSDWTILTNWEINKTYYPGDIVTFDGTKFKDSTGQYGFPGYGEETVAGSSTPEEYIYPDLTTETLEIDEDIDGTFSITTGISATGPNGGLVELFQCIGTTSITDPTQTIDDDNNWTSYPPTGYNSIFYQPTRSYVSWDEISASYSYLVEKTGVNYNYLNYFAIYKGEYFKCVISQTSFTNKSPEYIGIGVDDGLKVDYWETIEEYSTTKNYTADEIVTSNEELYYYDNSTQELSLIHTFKPLSETPYEIYDNVKFNDNYYMDTTGDSLLDNGINIYINHKWKNILVHLYFNDNLAPVFNINRKDLYCPELQQISATNVIDTINSINLKNGFINNIKYYVIESDDSYTKYDMSNIESIPYIIQMETPTELEYYSHSLGKTPESISKDISYNKLVNNNLVNYTEVDFYNRSPLGVKFERPDVFNYLDKTNILYRFNGQYNPIFNEINIFSNMDGDRYIFDENLDEFGNVTEFIKSKVNEKENLLRIEEETFKSIYPQIDEIGYFIDNHNIFKSTWDKKFYKKAEKNKP